MYSFLVFIEGFVLFLRFSTDYFYEKQLNNSSDDLVYFFNQYPYAILFIGLLGIAGLLWLLKKNLLLLRKGYVAEISPEGIRLADGRFIVWYEIETIEKIYHKNRYSKASPKPSWAYLVLKPVPTKNVLLRIFNKKIHKIIMLSNFKIGVLDVHRLLNEYSNQYR